MGATIQKTRYSEEKKLILTDDSGVPEGADIKTISGSDVLTNNQVSFHYSSDLFNLTCIQVNLLSSLLTAILVAWAA